jgi:hypothetical protein
MIKSMNQNKSVVVAGSFLRIMGVLDVIIVGMGILSSLALSSIWGEGLTLFGLAIYVAVLLFPFSFFVTAHYLKLQKEKAYSYGIIQIIITGLYLLYTLFGSFVFLITKIQYIFSVDYLLFSLPSIIALVIVCYCPFGVVALYKEKKIIYGRDRNLVILLTLLLLAGGVFVSITGINEVRQDIAFENEGKKIQELMASLPQSGSLVTRRGVVLSNTGTDGFPGIQVISLQSEGGTPNETGVRAMYHLGPDITYPLCKYYNPNAANLKKGDKIEVYGRVDGYTSTQDTIVTVSTCDTPDFYIKKI